MSTRLELFKVIVQSVVAVREDGRVVNEIEGERVACYGPDALLAYWRQAEAEVAAKNVQIVAGENGSGDGGLVPDEPEEVET